MKSPGISYHTHPNRMGITGWIYGGPYRLERFLYTIHRATGLGVLLYLVMHIGVTWFKNDPGTWKILMDMLEMPAFRFGEYIVFFGVVFHAINGIRLIVGEFGFLMGKPKMPVYPYPLALLRQRPFLVALMVITGILVIYGAIEIMGPMLIQ
ncbi:MAG: hypothetical protein RDV48_16265 [Candidatus Eremiobacteraeota bacterium]|nr:hypothetical protein [Candidatus Eremiobacteraeota bacterium]